MYARFIFKIALDSWVMQPYVIVERPAMRVVGIACRTAPETAGADIPQLWETFYREAFFNRIQDKTSEETLGLYCDYAGDYTQPYTLVIGCESAASSVAAPLVLKTLPASHYALFEAKGEFPASVIETWKTIWQTPLKRTYTGDFEVYDASFQTDPQKPVRIYIAIKP